MELSADRNRSAEAKFETKRKRIGSSSRKPQCPTEKGIRHRKGQTSSTNQHNRNFFESLTHFSKR